MKTRQQQIIDATNEYFKAYLEREPGLQAAYGGHKIQMAYSAFMMRLPGATSESVAFWAEQLGMHWRMASMSYDSAEYAGRMNRNKPGECPAKAMGAKECPYCDAK